MTVLVPATKHITTIIRMSKQLSNVSYKLSKTSWSVWQAAMAFSRLCVIVLRSHVLRRLIVLNEHTAVQEVAGLKSSKRTSTSLHLQFEPGSNQYVDPGRGNVGRVLTLGPELDWRHIVVSHKQSNQCAVLLTYMETPVSKTCTCLIANTVWSVSERSEARLSLFVALYKISALTFNFRPLWVTAGHVCVLLYTGRSLFLLLRVDRCLPYLAENILINTKIIHLPSSPILNVAALPLGKIVLSISDVVSSVLYGWLWKNVFSAEITIQTCKVRVHFQFVSLSQHQNRFFSEPPRPTYY